VHLSPEAGRFWRAAFSASAWGSVLYAGRWEQTFGRLARVNRWLTGRRGSRLFEHTTLAAQEAY